MKGKHAGKIILAAIILILIGLFWALDLGRYLTLDYLKSSQAWLTDLYTRHTWLMLGGYGLVYIVVTALSLPGAAVMSLAGAAIFGFVPTLVVVSFASTIGATLACAVSRFILQGWVQGRFGDRLEAINRGIENEGSFYLFTLRLVPIFPFFVINLVMGLTRMPLRTFYWVSQVGMLPGTAVYINAGTELGKIESLSGILSPSLLISFAILGLFPITVKKLLAWYRTRQSQA